LSNSGAFRRPESVLVVVYTRDGRVLLLRRVRPFDFWQSVTGSLRPGETHAEAAVRELSEETGLLDEGRLSFTGVTRQFTIDPRWRHRFEPGVIENVEYEYRYELHTAVSLTLATDEHEEYCWLPKAAALEKVWSWTNRDAIDALPI